MWKSKKKILKELNEPQPLPMGRAEFEAWSDRIIAAALIPGATKESQKAVLGERLLHVPPTESFMPDSYFIQTLRRVVVNQVGHAMFEEYRAKEKARLEKEEKQNNEAKVLEDKVVPKAAGGVGEETGKGRVRGR